MSEMVIVTPRDQEWVDFYAKLLAAAEARIVELLIKLADANAQIAELEGKLSMSEGVGMLNQWAGPQRPR